MLAALATPRYRQVRRNHQPHLPTTQTLFLYGSRPPPNDSVWKAFETNKVKTNIHDHTHGGKEKDVNNSMSVDMAVKAVELQVEAEFRAKHFSDLKAAEKKNKTIFIVITGDCNIMPAVKRVLDCNIRVELWGWKSGISQVYLDRAAINSLLSVTIVLRNVNESDKDAIYNRLPNLMLKNAVENASSRSGNTNSQISGYNSGF
ncbi:hypothetical protein B0T25DRAFT_562919 [Lasiosphaeria hispida]|uniref:NYN domain-containing protein n=1 Tax=Lasiosphaeria hispida TaxID=260671 RepID=A0AAJ0MKL9_9PEZI|nr:hypothetical protein B0T25DRAFT_562919 [Lasiosphaeria hispida]